MDTPIPVAPAVAAPAAPASPAAAAQAQIDAIFADPTHAYHRGAPRATEEVYRLHQVVHGTAPEAGGPQLGPDPAARLAGPIEHESLQAFGESFAQAGVPKDYAQGVIDVVTGFTSDLPAPPAGYVPMTADMGRAALEMELGAAGASAELQKAQRVIAVLKSLGPDVQDRLDYALGASGAGNLPGVVREFARLHDLSPADAWRKVAHTFGGPAAVKLFGPEPRR